LNRNYIWRYLRWRWREGIRWRWREGIGWRWREGLWLFSGFHFVPEE
jgi:hypothetical protein